MIASDYNNVVQPDNKLKKATEAPVIRLLPPAKEIKKIAEVIAQHKEDEFPIEKWTMPPELHRYIKCKKNDLL